jgi:hypothetical protein
MPHNSREKHSTVVTNVAMRIGLTAAALTGQAATVNHEVITSPPAAMASLDPSTNPTELVASDNTGTEVAVGPNISPEIPTALKTFLDNNTLYIDNDGCSGIAIHMNGDQSKPIVGGGFAAHCGFLKNVPSDRYWMGANYETGSDGKTYVVKPPLIAETGLASNNLTPLGQFDQVIVSSTNMNDRIYGILPGFNPEQVEEGYRQEHITTAEADKLIPGVSKGVVRGWPVNQNESQPGVMTAQEFPMTYVGKFASRPDSGENLEVTVWAIKKDENGAVCSWGDSGANGVTMADGQPKLLGPMSVFWSFDKIVGNVDPSVFNNNTGPQEDLEYMQEQFPDIDWSKYSAACAFDLPAPKSTTLINVVPDSIFIPGRGGSQAELSIYQTELEFANPNIPHTIVNGTVVIKCIDKGGGDATSLAINNPMISTAEDGTVNLGYYDAYSPGQINVINAPINQLVFYKNQELPLETTNATGQIIYPSNAVLSKTVGITIGDEQSVGESVNPEGLVNNSETAYALNIVDNQYNFVPEAQNNKQLS